MVQCNVRGCEALGGGTCGGRGIGRRGGFRGRTFVGNCTSVKIFINWSKLGIDEKRNLTRYYMRNLWDPQRRTKMGTEEEDEKFLLKFAKWKE